MFLRKWIVLPLLAVLLLVVPAAGAQDAEPFCGSLSPEDCALLNAARNPGIESASADFNFLLEIDVGNPRGNTEIAISGTAVFLGDPSLISLPAQDAPPEESIAWLVALMRGYDTQLHMIINLPPELRAGLPRGVDEIVIEMRIVEGITYINLDTLEPLINDPNLEGWMGVDLASLFEEVAEEQPELLGESNTATSDLDPEVQAELDALNTSDEVVDLTRVDNREGDTATFVTVANFSAFLDNPTFAQVFRQAMEAQLQTQSPAPSAQEQKESIDLVISLFRALELRIAEDVTVATQLPAAAEVELFIDLESVEVPDPLLGASGSFLITFDATFDDINAVRAVNPPAGAVIFPYRFLLDAMLAQQR
jgi:hypothetical protein